MRHLLLFNQVIVESRFIEAFEECDSNGNRPMLNQCRNGSFYRIDSSAGLYQGLKQGLLSEFRLVVVVRDVANEASFVQMWRVELAEFATNMELMGTDLWRRDHAEDQQASGLLDSQPCDYGSRSSALFAHSVVSLTFSNRLSTETVRKSQ